MELLEQYFAMHINGGDMIREDSSHLEELLKAYKDAQEGKVFSLEGDKIVGILDNNGYPTPLYQSSPSDALKRNLSVVISSLKSKIADIKDEKNEFNLKIEEMENRIVMRYSKKDLDEYLGRVVYNLHALSTARIDGIFQRKDKILVASEILKKKEELLSDLIGRYSSVKTEHIKKTASHILRKIEPAHIGEYIQIGNDFSSYLESLSEKYHNRKFRWILPWLHKMDNKEYAKFMNDVVGHTRYDGYIMNSYILPKLNIFGNMRDDVHLEMPLYGHFLGDALILSGIPFFNTPMVSLFILGMGLKIINRGMADAFGEYKNIVDDHLVYLVEAKNKVLNDE